MNAYDNLRLALLDLSSLSLDSAVDREAAYRALEAGVVEPLLRELRLAQKYLGDHADRRPLDHEIGMWDERVGRILGPTPEEP
jgi:hypothetical protein